LNHDTKISINLQVDRLLMNGITGRTRVRRNGRLIKA